MSRIGKKAIEIPKDVVVKLEQQNITVKGKFGLLTKSYSDILQIILNENKIIIGKAFCQLRLSTNQEEYGSCG